MAELYSSCMFEPILSTSMCVANKPESTVSLFGTLYCSNCGYSKSVGFANLSASKLVLESMEIVKVSQLYSYQNDCSRCMDGSEWHFGAHSMLLLCLVGTVGASEVGLRYCSS